MGEITIVTAFFDIKRGDWNQSSMGNEEYLRHFSSWAGIKNNIIVYTDFNMAERVLNVRSDYGLREKTKVVVIDDYLSLDKELLNSITTAMNAPHAREYHFKPDHPEAWNPIYNYVMLLKWWSVCDAINKGYAKGNIAWIDFGFNKSGTYYTKPDEISFLWDVELEHKIHLFSINELDQIPIYEVIQRMDTYIQGCNIIAPDVLWLQFWNDVRTAMLELNNCGLCDDDQVLMLMAYRKHPELYKVIKCPWFGIFTATGVNGLTVRGTKPDISIKGKIRALRKKVNYKKMVRRYIKIQKKILLIRNTLSD